jgi:hypothetical protein
MSCYEESYHVFIRQLFSGTLVLPQQERQEPRRLRREHGGNFSSLSGSLLWLYMNRENLNGLTPLEYLFTSPFFSPLHAQHEHTHSVDLALESCIEAFDDHVEDPSSDDCNSSTFQ